jgi:hypothetical protein
VVAHRLFWQVRVPVQVGLAISQHGWLLPPQARQLPPLASVAPPQHAPAAQPRPQFWSADPAPSDRHAREVEPAHTLDPGSQTLHARRVALHPKGHVSLVLPVPSFSHVSRIFPLQVLAPGRQALQAIRLTLHPNGQVCLSLGSPPALHWRRTSPLHQFVEGRHPRHSPVEALQPEVQTIVSVPDPSALQMTAVETSHARVFGRQALHSCRLGSQPFAQTVVFRRAGGVAGAEDVPDAHLRDRSAASVRLFSIHGLIRGIGSSNGTSGRSVTHFLASRGAACSPQMSVRAARSCRLRPVRSFYRPSVRPRLGKAGKHPGQGNEDQW